MTKAPELLPCPFCGNDGSKYRLNVAEAATRHAGWSHVVECTECGAEGAYASSLNAAVKMWNTRTDHALALVAAGRAEVLDAMDAFNTLPPDENGHCWRESDLLDQEVMRLRARTPDDATAALKARDARIRNEALREALVVVGRILDAVEVEYGGGGIGHAACRVGNALGALITEGQSDGE